MPTSNVYASEAKTTERAKIKRVCGNAVGRPINVGEYGEIPSHGKKGQQWQTESRSPQVTPYQEPPQDIRSKQFSPRSGKAKKRADKRARGGRIGMADGGGARQYQPLDVQDLVQMPPQQLNALSDRLYGPKGIPPNSGGGGPLAGSGSRAQQLADPVLHPEMQHTIWDNKGAYRSDQGSLHEGGPQGGAFSAEENLGAPGRANPGEYRPSKWDTQPGQRSGYTGMYVPGDGGQSAAPEPEGDDVPSWRAPEDGGDSGVPTSKRGGTTHSHIHKHLHVHKKKNGGAVDDDELPKTLSGFRQKGLNVRRTEQPSLLKREPRPQRTAFDDPAPRKRDDR